MRKRFVKLLSLLLSTVVFLSIAGVAAPPASAAVSTSSVTFYHWKRVSSSEELYALNATDTYYEFILVTSETAGSLHYRSLDWGDGRSTEAISDSSVASYIVPLAGTPTEFVTTVSPQKMYSYEASYDGWDSSNNSPSYKLRNNNNKWAKVHDKTSGYDSWLRFDGSSRSDGSALVFDWWDDGYDILIYQNRPSQWDSCVSYWWENGTFRIDSTASHGESAADHCRPFWLYYLVSSEVHLSVDSNYTVASGQTETLNNILVNNGVVLTVSEGGTLILSGTVYLHGSIVADGGTVIFAPGSDVTLLHDLCYGLGSHNQITLKNGGNCLVMNDARWYGSSVFGALLCSRGSFVNYGEVELSYYAPTAPTLDKCLLVNGSSGTMIFRIPFTLGQNSALINRGTASCGDSKLTFSWPIRREIHPLVNKGVIVNYNDLDGPADSYLDNTNGQYYYGAGSKNPDFTAAGSQLDVSKLSAQEQGSFDTLVNDLVYRGMEDDGTGRAELLAMGGEPLAELVDAAPTVDGYSLYSASLFSSGSAGLFLLCAVGGFGVGALLFASVLRRRKPRS